MKRVTRNSVIAIAVASGAMAVAGTAHADSTAQGTASGSPGVLSGNNVQVPLDVPVNVCGNTVDVVGLLNPAMGNRCANTGHDTDHKSTKKHGSAASGTRGSGKAGSDKAGSHTAGSDEAGPTRSDRAGSVTSGGAEAVGVADDSPGLLSGNGLGLPIDLPVNLSGNGVNVVGALNPVFGNESVNGSDEDQPGKSTPRAHQPRHPGHPKAGGTIVEPQATATLAHTGAGDLWAPAVASLASLTAGAVLYRRSRRRMTV